MALAGVLLSRSSPTAVVATMVVVMAVPGAISLAVGVLDEEPEEVAGAVSVT